MSHANLRLPIAKATASILQDTEFKRKGASFTKHSEGWTEHYVITGNRWNSGELPWLFYIDVGLELLGVPPKAGAKGLWKHCHAVGSMSALCAALPPDFAAQPDSLASAGKQVAEALPILSRAVAAQVQQVRVRALQGFLSPLPVPTSWATTNAA
jgi:hypothetical protein